MNTQIAELCIFWWYQRLNIS